MPQLRPRVITGWAVLAVITLLRCGTAGLNQDARFVLGALSAGWSPMTTWTHRPLVFRLLMSPFAGWGPNPWSEAAIRVILVALVLGASVTLARGLVGHTPRPRVVAVATGAALAWAPGWDFAEPEWFATVFAVAALGLGLRDRPGDGQATQRLCAAFAPVLLALAVLVKYTTAPIAVVAVLVVWWRRGRTRGALLALQGVAVTGIGSVLTILGSGPEYQWLAQMSLLNPSFDPHQWRAMVQGFANLPLVAPIVAVGVAIVPSLVRQRPRTAAAVVGAVAVLALPFVVQQQNFLYHLAPIAVFCAGVVTAVIVDPDLAIPRRAAAVCGLGLVPVVAVLWAFPAPTRNAHWELALLAVLAVIVGSWLVTSPRVTRALPLPRLGRHIRLGSTALTCLALLPLGSPLVPWVTYSYSLAHRETTDLANRAMARPLHISGVGSDSTVVYLSFSGPYRMGNPSACPYVSPTWLQRSAQHPEVVQTSSFATNLACLSAPDAEFLIVETDWFDPATANPVVTRSIEANYLCDMPVGTTEGFIACARR